MCPDYLLGFGLSREGVSVDPGSCARGVCLDLDLALKGPLSIREDVLVFLSVYLFIYKFMNCSRGLFWGLFGSGWILIYREEGRSRSGHVCSDCLIGF